MFLGFDYFIYSPKDHNMKSEIRDYTVITQPQFTVIYSANTNRFKNT